MVSEGIQEEMKTVSVGNVTYVWIEPGPSPLILKTNDLLTPILYAEFLACSAVAPNIVISRGISYFVSGSW